MPAWERFARQEGESTEDRLKRLQEWTTNDPYRGAYPGVTTDIQAE